jgi:hypothetical protein
MSATRAIQSSASALALVLLAQPAGAQNYIHGVLAKYKPQQLAINDCMFSVSQGGAFHACMFRAGHRFCSNCRILGIGGYLPGSTTSAPCWIDAEEIALATEGPPDIAPPRTLQSAADRSGVTGSLNSGPQPPVQRVTQQFQKTGPTNSFADVQVGPSALRPEDQPAGPEPIPINDIAANSSTNARSVISAEHSEQHARG